LVKVTATLGATYAGNDYMHHYFSVTPVQAAASLANLAAFDADAGIKDVYIGAVGVIPLSEAWTLRVAAKYTRLVGDAADSPVVESADQFSGTVGLSYRLGWGR
jgi:outer membrane scaffolding protein for murein synthesis (MipA/OmpV family)